MKPEIAKTRSQFAHRISQTFTGPDEETRETLLQIFDLRSSVEHMHDILDVLEGDNATRVAFANRRTRQIDVLARVAMCRVLEDDALFEMFRLEAGIDAFWGLADADRAAAWGERLDLPTIL